MLKATVGVFKASLVPPGHAYGQFENTSTEWLVHLEDDRSGEHIAVYGLDTFRSFKSVLVNDSQMPDWDMDGHKLSALQAALQRPPIYLAVDHDGTVVALFTNAQHARSFAQTHGLTHIDINPETDAVPAIGDRFVG